MALNRISDVLCKPDLERVSMNYGTNDFVVRTSGND